jgi:hypothetical protein
MGCLFDCGFQNFPQLFDFFLLVFAASILKVGTDLRKNALFLLSLQLFPDMTVDGAALFNDFRINLFMVLFK